MNFGSPCTCSGESKRVEGTKLVVVGSIERWSTNPNVVGSDSTPDEVFALCLLTLPSVIFTYDLILIFCSSRLGVHLPSRGNNCSKMDSFEIPLPSSHLGDPAEQCVVHCCTKLVVRYVLGDATSARMELIQALQPRIKTVRARSC